MDIFLGIWIGVIISSIVLSLRYAKIHGTLKIDNSNPEKDVYRIEIDDLDNLSSKKRIVLNVVKEKLTQE